ncbi:hypothetical protein MMC07_003028 [Pseudocyphellaria aurata]|nr:hypothetical protein [Pseudocyphellaria aurata]
MDQLYMPPGTDCCASPLQYATIPDLRSCGYSEAMTDPSPSPPMMFTHLDGFEYNLYGNPTDTPHFLDHQPAILNSIEFMDLTAPQHEDRRRRRSTTAQDKETVSNMRIRRRAQNRASQRAFRERKEKHVQHLEEQLEDLETKHRTLAKSYTDLDSTHDKLKREVKQLRGELESLKSSRESSVIGSNSSSRDPSLFDSLAADGLFETGGDLGF